MSDKPMINQLGDPSAKGTPEQIMAQLQKRPVPRDTQYDPSIETYATDRDVPVLLWAALKQAGIVAKTISYHECRSQMEKAAKLFAESVGWDR